MRGWAILALSIIATGCATIAGAESAEAETISICDVASRQDALLAQTHYIRGYIERDQHGLYASGLDCPKEYIWVVLRDRSDANAREELMANLVQQFDKPTDEIVFKARIAMNDYKLPLTTHVSPRLSLEFISREGAVR